jgi:hypothetical protein
MLFGKFTGYIKVGLRMTAPEPHWTAYATALLTPVVAVIGAYIGWRQSRTAQNKLKLDLFEKRFAVYNKARNLLSEVMTKGKLTDAGLYEYGAGVREAKWLMDAEVAAYLSEELWNNAVHLQTYDAELDGLPVGEERTKLVHKRAELKKWFYNQYPVLDAKVEKFLKLSH